MTAYTINTGGVVRFDSLTAPSANASLDTYTLSAGSTLLLDTDSYQCPNRSAATGSLDTVAFAGIGGTLKIDGTSVRVIPFNTGAGTVPAIGATISQGGVSAVFLGVWANWQSEPLAAAAAMPATGFIKVRAKTGGNFAAGALTGISASATGTDAVGWIEVRGADTASITVPRIGKVEVLGDWFELGTTSGARGQVLACPTTATVAGVFPGIWVETASGSGVYERWAGVGSMANNAANPTDERGKVFWQTTSGIRIGSDGTNNVGFLPPSGCRVRIPNVILTCCTRTAGGSGLRVLPSATLTTRQEFITTSAGDFDISHCVMNWYANFSQAFRTKIRNSAINDTLVQSEIASPIDVDNLIVAPTQAQLNFALNMASCFAGGTFANATLARFSLAASGAYACVVNFSRCAFENVRALTLTNRANATTGTWTCTQSLDCTWTGCTDIGGRMLHIGSQRPVVTGLAYADSFAGTTGTTNGHAAVDLTTGTVSPKVDGFTILGTNLQPYAAVVQATASYDITVRNIGTFASPLNLGATNGTGLLFNSGGNNDGIRLQRLYASNTRTGPYAFVNSDTDVTIESVQGDDADTSAMAALNAVMKGVRMAGSSTGQVSVYGTHWGDFFTSATAGKVEMFCNEPTAASAAQCQATGGTPRFNSAGQVALTAIGDQVTWEMPYIAKGHTSFQNVAPVISGTNTGNSIYEYQIDTGSGYSAWKTLSAANLSAEAITAAGGFRLKIRATCATANAGNLLTQIRVLTSTTATDQSTNRYPLDTFTLTLTGLQSGSDIVVLQAGTETERVNVDANAGASYGYVYETSEAVDIAVFKAGHVPYFVRNFTLPAANSNLPIAQVADRAYANP
jgi:hypothetical protein